MCEATSSRARARKRGHELASTCTHDARIVSYAKVAYSQRVSAEVTLPLPHPKFSLWRLVMCWLLMSKAGYASPADYSNLLFTPEATRPF